ncbi:MAG: recombination-associated protein RdgC [Desulfovibrionaceae bacterium]|nr:recombination-associated protein RdgC [Desulfovibrionaceae bacterium]
MSFLGSSTSFTRFTINDAIPEDFWSSILDKLKQFAFHDIDDLPEERSFGWVSFDDMLDSEWESGSPYKGNVLAFALRLDTRRIPAGVVKKHTLMAYKQELQKLAEINKTFIARERKKEIKEEILLKLRQRFLPVPAIFDVIWLSDKNEVWFGSTQSKMIDLFIEYFHQSFGFNLEQLRPVALAQKYLDEDTALRLETLEETQFVVPGA